MSSRNPFRHAAQEVALPAPPSPPLPPIPDEDPKRSVPAPPSPTIASSSRAPPPGPSSSASITEMIEEDLPPPYTPAANAGEETVGLGPRRPFQEPPRIPSSSQPNWPPPTGPSYSRPGPALAPWQSQQQYRLRQSPGGGGLLGALFDTVRDIADVVSGAHDERMIAAQRANAGAYASPYSSGGPNSAYAPPPGPPGPPRAPPPSQRPASTPPRSPPAIPDDGSPTRTPVPGHPLLRDGNLLVYPKDHLCVKCKNTGYKNYDPSNPCRKCWDKYGKAYTGILTYTPWSSSGNDPRMQRPLPKFVPPHLAPDSASSAYAQPFRGPYLSPSQNLQHSRSVSQPYFGHSPPPGPSYYVLNPLTPYEGPPVPHAIPVSPGDPRLGGQLCFRCGGAGTRTVMLIDVMTCETCGGTGRVWM